MWVAKGQERICLSPKMANRHGLITGATGTGKTVTLKVLAEGFSDMGVPVFLADIKGDVSGMCKAGEPSENVDGRVREMGVDGFSYTAYPVRFWDVYGKLGVPVRTTISDMGPDLLSRIMELSDVQEEVLAVVFKIADDNGWLLIDTKDLRAMLAYVSEHAGEYSAMYGNMTAQSLASIQRNVVVLEEAGGTVFFGEPALSIADWLCQDDTGRGIINLLSCVQLVQSPLLYSTFLLWMLSELYELLPEAGDLDKPKIVFFFDEAHLLFHDAPKALLSKVEQVARLIRSKGVGVYFISQSPADVPDTVLAQLGNKIQHALRAYTPAEQKAVRAAAQSFRANPAFDTEEAIGALGTGEALVSLLGTDGVPQVVERAKILPPRSFMGAAEEDLIRQRIANSPLYGKYAAAVDGVSAYEQLSDVHAAAQQQAAEAAAAAEQQKQAEAAEKERQKQEAAAAKEQEKQAAAQQKEIEKLKAAEEKRQQKEIEQLKRKQEREAERRKQRMESVATSMFRTAGTSIVRNLLGTKRR
ncbi:MAG: DUF853 domain-containing protein [Clostridiales Family XIII bacterium]|nr:DUF853 domain-containing protein [Clostridiales Family XIII bacterium]